MTVSESVPLFKSGLGVFRTRIEDKLAILPEKQGICDPVDNPINLFAEKQLVFIIMATCVI